MVKSIPEHLLKSYPGGPHLQNKKAADLTQKCSLRSFVALGQAELREPREAVPNGTLELAVEAVESYRRPGDADLFLDGMRKAELK